MSAPTNPSAVTHRAIARFDAIKWRFDATSAAAKAKLITSLERRAIRSSRWLLVYHDALCVVSTYPETGALRQQAQRALKVFPQRLIRGTRAGRDQLQYELQDTGLGQTYVVHPFSFELCTHLISRYPGQIEIGWDEVEDESLDRLLKVLVLLVIWSENDSLDYDPEVDARPWLRRARSRSDRTDLETLIRLFRQSRLEPATQRHLFDELMLPVCWQIGKAPVSRTLHRLPHKKIFYQTEPRRPRCDNLRTELAKPPTPLVKLSTQQGRMYIEALQDAHAVRNRELFPVIFANPAEVYLNEPGRGIGFVIFGMIPEMRLPFESNFGAIIVRNGMPVGYGIAAPWFDRSEIAINIFPAYRSGESAFIFEQFFRVFHHHFDAKAFFVRSHQMGEDDDEPLKSGAFWFYYKLGFRAKNPAVRRIAQQEVAKMKRKPGYRSSLDTLRSMSHTDVFLHSDPRQTASYREPSLVNLSYAITDYYARTEDGNRQTQTEEAARQVQKMLRVPHLRGWSRGERLALERWAPLLANAKTVSKWSNRDKRGMVDIIRAKGGRSERDFILLCNQHPKLRRALETVAARAARRPV
jgi:hypothetical protein